MAVRFQVRQGTSEPSTSDLLNRELGVDTSSLKAYVRIGSNIIELEQVAKNNTTTVDPGVNDDASEGYISMRSHWHNSTSGKVFICTDNTDGAATWVQLN